MTDNTQYLTLFVVVLTLGSVTVVVVINNPLLLDYRINVMVLLDIIESG